MAHQKKFKKTHPYSILRQMRISVLLILLSVLQQFLVRPQGLLEIIGSLGLNAFYVTVILSYTLSVYGNFKYCTDAHCVHICKGVFIRKSFTIPYHSIRTIVFYRDIFSSLFGAERISIDTPAGSTRRYDMTSYFSRRIASDIRNMLHRKTVSAVSYRSRTMSIIVMAAFWSNPVTGLIFIVPVVNNAGKILGREVADNLVRSSIYSPVRYMVHFISPAAATIASVILVSWTISMILCFLRYVRLCTYRIGDYIIISRGLLSHSMTYTRVSGISSVNIDQSLLMKLMHLKSCSISVIGSGKLKGDKGMILSAEKAEDIRRKMTDLTGITHDEVKRISVARGSIFTYIRLPLLALLLPAGFFMLRYLLPQLRETITFLSYVVLFVVLWWLLFRIFAYRSSYIAFSQQCLIVCSYHRLTLRKYYIPFDNIQKIEVSQSTMQKYSGKCNVHVCLYAEKRTICTVRQLPKSQVDQILENSG